MATSTAAAWAGASAALRSLRSLGADIRDARAQAARHRPRPPGTGLVVEVGGGQRPSARADVVVDKYVEDDFERAGGAPLDTSRPLVVADGEALPFDDGSAAYVIAMHVLEHATDPVRFAAELSRVGQAGFVQVPSRAAELTVGWPFHPWLIDREGAALVFEPKGDRQPPVGDLFHAEFERSATMRLWWASRLSLWLHSIEWKGSLQVAVAGSSKAEQTASFDAERTVAALARLGARDGVRGPVAAVREALRCPACGGGLAWAAQEAGCMACGARYPVVATVPLLLTEARLDR